MDDKRFDELSKLLAPAVTRSGFCGRMAALSIAALSWMTRAGSAEARTRKVSASKGKGHKRKGHTGKGHKGKGKGHKEKNPLRTIVNNCPQGKKNAICHCPNGQVGANCEINCVGAGGGHENDIFDCMCAGRIGNIPNCAPERCPATAINNAACGGPTTCQGLCQTQAQCISQSNGCVCLGLSGGGSGACGACIPDGRAPGSAAECCSGEFCPTTGLCGSCACTGPCTAAPCSGLSTNCVCRTLAGQCGPCILDGDPAGSATECCSGTVCAATGRCGPCTCAATCTVQTDCTGLGVADCVCRTLTGQCGSCIPDGDAAASAAECCSGDFCAANGVCGSCACTGSAASCEDQGSCSGLATNCVCRTLAGQCGPCIVDGRSAGSVAECCSDTFCAATGRCGACTCAATCTVQTDCTGLGVADCVCQTLVGRCDACIGDDRPAGSAAECCASQFCTATGRCGACVCGGACSAQSECTGLGVAGCVCQTLQGLCGACIPDGGQAGSAAECCSGAICGTQCGACPGRVCTGSACTSDAACQGQGDACVCFSSGACNECLTTGGACGATSECCGQLHCAAGVCGLTKARRKHCTEHGRPCGSDGQCCGQGVCYQGKCGEKDTHCHHNGECAKGYHCVGGRSVGDHRRCRKIGSKKHRRQPKK